MLEDAVWEDVCSLLADPKRIEQEYQRRLTSTADGLGSTVDQLQKQIQKVKRGMARIVDAYEDGWLEKVDFKQRIGRAKQRLGQLDAQARTIADADAERRELRLVIGHIRDFADRVGDRLYEADWATRREVIRALIKEVQVGGESVRIVYKVGPAAFGGSSDRDPVFLQDRGRRAQALQSPVCSCMIAPTCVRRWRSWHRLSQAFVGQANGELGGTMSDNPDRCVAVRTATASRTLRTAAVLVMGMALAGCASLKSVHDMRNLDPTVDQEKIAKQHETLLKSFTKKTAWAMRVEIMTSLAWQNDALRYAEDNPALNASLIAQLRTEYATPRIKHKRNDPLSETDADYVRAFAVYTLGSLQQEPLLPFFLAVFETNSVNNDPAFGIRQPALSALKPMTASLKADPDYTNRMLVAVLSMRQELEIAPLDQATSEWLDAALRHFEVQLKTHESIVRLLNERLKSMSPKMILDLLDWNYDLVRKLGAERVETLFDENIASLVEALVWHDDARVRSRTRSLMIKMAPAKLLAAVGRRIRNGTSGFDDCEQLVLVLRYADLHWKYECGPIAPPSAADAPYVKLRREAVAAMLDAVHEIDFNRRERVYARLLKCDDHLLAAHLLESNDMVLFYPGAEDQLQHIRYLEDLRDEACARDVPRATEIEHAIGSFMEVPSLRIRATVVSCLIESRPALLANHIDDTLATIASEDARTRSLLIASFIDCLEHMEAKRDAGAQSVDQAGLNTGYVALATCIPEVQLDLRGTIVDYLGDRDPGGAIEALTRSLTDQMASGSSPKIREFAMLGDTLHASRVGMKPAVRTVLRNGVALADEETSLLCASYLLESEGERGLEGLGEQLPAVSRLKSAWREANKARMEGR